MYLWPRLFPRRLILVYNCSVYTYILLDYHGWTGKKRAYQVPGIKYFEVIKIKGFLNQKQVHLVYFGPKTGTH